jgi:hypothetical protein
VSLITRRQYLNVLADAASWATRVNIVTFGAPHTWPTNSPVREVLFTLGKRKVETVIYVGLPAPDSEVYNDHIERTESFARVWRLVEWRFVPFSHVKYYLIYRHDELVMGAVGSINLADSRLNDLAVTLTADPLKELARIHRVTHRMSRTVDSGPLPLPPADWAERILKDVDYDEE